MSVTAKTCNASSSGRRGSFAQARRRAEFGLEVQPEAQAGNVLALAAIVPKVKDHQRNQYRKSAQRPGSEQAHELVTGVAPRREGRAELSPALLRPWVPS